MFLAEKTNKYKSVASYVPDKTKILLIFPAKFCYNCLSFIFLLHFKHTSKLCTLMHIAVSCCVPNASTHEKNFRNFTIKLCRKNNLAAKKSRDARRVRENQLRLRVLCLENANRVLREQMDRKDVELVQLR